MGEGLLAVVTRMVAVPYMKLCNIALSGRRYIQLLLCWVHLTEQVETTKLPAVVVVTTAEPATVAAMAVPSVHC